MHTRIQDTSRNVHKVPYMSHSFLLVLIIPTTLLACIFSSPLLPEYCVHTHETSSNRIISWAFIVSALTYIIFYQTLARVCVCLKVINMFIIENIQQEHGSNVMLVFHNNNGVYHSANYYFQYNNQNRYIWLIN